MKRLLGLCALFFAGHAMACSTALPQGSYTGRTDGKVLGAEIHSVAEALLDGTGHGQAVLRISIAGIIVPEFQTSIADEVRATGTGSTNCHYKVTVPLGSVLNSLLSPLQLLSLPPNLPPNLVYEGYGPANLGPNNGKIEFTTTTPGTAISGDVQKTD